MLSQKYKEKHQSIHQYNFEHAIGGFRLILSPYLDFLLFTYSTLKVILMNRFMLFYILGITKCNFIMIKRDESRNASIVL